MRVARSNDGCFKLSIKTKQYFGRQDVPHFLLNIYFLFMDFFNLVLFFFQFLYETSPFPVVMAEIAIHGFKEVSDLSVCLKDIISRMMTHSVKVIGDFNRCIHNIEMPKLKYLLKFMKKYA